MDRVYVVFENGIETNEWWLLQTFTTYEEAKDYLDVMYDDECTSTYIIVEYSKGTIVTKVTENGVEENETV